MEPIEPVMRIPGNEHVLARLRELVSSEQAIAFVGAGASAELYPLWDALIAQLAGQAVMRGLADAATRDAWLRIAARNPQQAVRGIKEALGRQVYGAVLGDIFGYRTGPDGNAFTPAHGLLLRLAFRGYVTTNYDPGLLEARRILRPQVRATGWATWKDPDLLRAWLTEEVFQGKQACPILYAHGFFEHSDSIVLGVGEYREAYQPGLFRTVVEALWSQQRLVFVGFGFSDAWFDVVAEQVLGLTSRQAAGEPRHIAILALPEDQEYAPALRGFFRDAYGSEVLFYPVRVTEQDGTRHEDHGLLPVVLQALGGAPPQTATEQTGAARAPENRAPTVPQRWVHDTSEDERYTEPADVLDRLTSWVRDERVRAIAVTGIGGLGKTALLGHWLKHREGTTVRQVAGLFGWSFNVDRSVKAFFTELVNFASTLPVRSHQDIARDSVEAAKAAVRAVPLVVLLDGLEVLQQPPGELIPEGPRQLPYGEFLDDDLREFLDAACRLKHTGLVLLTSRFPFEDLTPFLGSSLRHLLLKRLTPAEGALLLARLGVQGSEAERKEVARRYEGHPLALRVFAAAVARQAQGDPTRLLRVVFEQQGLHDDDPLEQKLRQLLGFYETQLPADRRALLGIVALFPDQVALSTVVLVAHELPKVRDHLQGLSETQLRAASNALVADGLLTRELDPAGEERYACHPVIRDHFRATLLAQDQQAASDAAGLLTGALSGQPRDTEELRVVTNAIALLIQAGELEQADRLYSEQLDSGYVFLNLPAPREGVQCALGFVADQGRRDLVRARLSERRLSWYLNEVGLFARNVAEFELAEHIYRDATDIDRQLGDDKALSVALQNWAELLVDLGRLLEAEGAVREALTLARDIEDEAEEMDALADLGTVLHLQGWVTDALAAFKDADHIERWRAPGHHGLYSTRGIRWADLLIRVGRTSQARQLTEANLRLVERNGWQLDVARCHWILGRLATLAGEHATAGEHLDKAATILRRGHQLADLIVVLLAQADLDRRRQAWEDAERAIEETHTIAASRRMRLLHADALILRGRLHLDRALSAHATGDGDRRLAAQQALDDAEAARTLAQACGYAWSERDAGLLLADIYEELGDAERAREHHNNAHTLGRRLQPDD